ncbi:hypothetical protein EJB05_04598, partial [Eragrostis curvula]
MNYNCYKGEDPDSTSGKARGNSLQYIYVMTQPIRPMHDSGGTLEEYETIIHILRFIALL